MVDNLLYLMKSRYIHTYAQYIILYMYTCIVYMYVHVHVHEVNNMPETSGYVHVYHTTYL